MIATNTLKEGVPIRDYSFKEMQVLNRNIYGTQNSMHYKPWMMVVRLHGYASVITKTARLYERRPEKVRLSDLGYDLAMGLSWTCALSNETKISTDIGQELWKHFPGVCPYCAEPVCDCVTKRPICRCESLVPHGKCPSTVQGFQKMFKSIYPRNTLLDSARHVGEEVTELDLEIEYYTGMKDDPSVIPRIRLEIADVVAQTIAVANCLEIDLAGEMEKAFCEGCPSCHRWPCIEGYVRSKMKVLK